MVRRQIIYTGRVQGVGFRFTARETAKRRPVSGWVRNEPDGSVTLQIQGETADVDLCLRDLERRMMRNIEARDVTELRPDPKESEFEIRHA